MLEREHEYEHEHEQTQSKHQRGMFFYGGLGTGEHILAAVLVA